jgi:predicted permease
MRLLRLRHLLRLLWRDRAISFGVVAVLALGIGSNTALFSVVNATLLKPLPYPSADRLVLLRLIDPDFRDRYPSFPANAKHIAEWQRACGACESLAAIKGFSTALTGTGDPEQLDGARVTAAFFGLLGIQPLAGRTFRAEDNRPGSERVVIISHGLWLRRFGGHAGVIGSRIRLDGQEHEIVGILPAGAPIPGPEQLGGLVRIPARIDVFRPAAFTAAELASGGDMDYGAIARLKPGIAREAARSELDGIERSISSSEGRRSPRFTLIEPLGDVVRRQARGSLLVLLAATTAVLLIVCVNVVNLLLARQTVRRRDAAIRTALGAGRRHLLQDALAESTLLACAGGAMGLLVAWPILRIILRVAPISLPRLNDIVMDGNVLLFLILTTLVVGAIVGALPAAGTASTEPADALKSGNYTATDGARGQRTRRLLIAGQAALSTALLVATGLLLTSFVKLTAVDKGFATSQILALDVVLPPFAYPSTERLLGFVDSVMERIRALPGVVDVAVTNRLPLHGEAVVNTLALQHDERPAAIKPLANYRYVSPEYFSAIGTPLLRGRTFATNDRGRHVVVLSAAAARVLFGEVDPIGRHVQTGGSLGALSEVIGVAADSRAVDLQRTDVLFAYLPYWLRGPSSASIVVRASADPLSLATAAKEAVWSVDRSVPIPRVQTMEDVVARAVGDRRFELSLMMLFGTSACLLAAMGVFGVVSYSVAKRRREMGIRVALGASPSNIRRHVVGEGLLPVGLGVAVGLAASLGLGPSMASRLFEVRPGDPLVMASAAAVLLTAAVMACLGPAHRAASVADVTTALRG